MMKRLHRTVVQIATLSTILAILATVIHELCFYWWLAPEFVDLPQAGDYIITAIRWLPAAALTISFAGMFAIIASRVDGRFWFSRRNRQHTSRLQKLYVVLSDLVVFGLVFFFFIVCISSLLFMANPPVMFVPLLFTPVWLFLVCRWFGIYKALDYWISRGSLTLSTGTGLVFSPIIVGFIAAFGVEDAQEIQDAEQGAYSINLKDTGVIEDILVVRNLAAGILIAIPSEKHVHFFPWSDIKAVTAEYSLERTESKLCEWLRDPSADGDQDTEWFLIRALERMCLLAPK